MPGRSYRVGRIAGIPVGVSPLWLVILALITWSLGDGYFPEEVHGIAPLAAYALGLASALLLFASILAHEFGHALVARRRGIEVEEIDLWLLGGVSRLHGEAHEPMDELRFALAGPAVTAVVGAVFGAIALALPASTPAALRALVTYQALINGMILVFNLMPAFPLDGGRVLRALLWRRSGEIASATDKAASWGRGFGYLLIGLGALEVLQGGPAGLWLALIGFFVVAAASAEATSAHVRAALGGMRVRELMSAPALSIPALTPAAELARDYFLLYPYTAFPVVDERGIALGLLSADQLGALAPAWQSSYSVSAGTIAERDPSLIVSAEELATAVLERPAFVRVGRAVAVDSEGRPVGLLSITDVQRALRASSLAVPGSSGQSPLAGGPRAAHG